MTGNSWQDIPVFAWFLFKKRLLTLPRFFLTMDRGRRLLFIPFFLISLGFMWGLYSLSCYVLQFLLQQGEVGEALIEQGMGMLLNTFFFLLVVSTVMAAATTLFQSRETRYLLTQPINALAIFWYKAAETILYSSWMVLLLGLPIFLALGTVLSVSLLSVVLFILLITLMVAISGLLGVLFSFAFTALLAVSTRLPRLAMALTVLSGGWYLFSAQSTSTSVLPDISNIPAIQAYIGQLRTSSPFFPGSWVQQAFFSLQKGQAGDTLYFALLLLVTFAFLAQVLTMMADRVYLRLWWLSGAQGRRSRKKAVHMHRMPVTPVAGVLLEKDIKLFIRDPRQWLQSGTLVGLFVFLIVILRQVPARFAHLEVIFGTIVAYLGFAIVGYLFTTLALRFIFPAMSLEGRSFWFLLTSPVSRTRLLSAKLVPLMLVLVAASTGMTFFVARLLSLPVEIQRISIIATAASVSVIAFLTFAVGTIWINLKESDPSKLASSVPAIVTTMILFGLLTSVIMILAVPFHSYFQSILLGELYDPGLTDRILIGLSAGAGVLDLLLFGAVVRSFGKRDF